MKRVCITGLGAVTPIGNDVKSFWENAVNGVNGIAPITHFDTAEYKAKVAAEIKDFDPTARIEKAAARKLDLYTQYALFAAAEAMEDSGLEGNIDGGELGVYVASGVGGINTLCENHDILHEKGPGRVSPLFVPKMIINIASGQVAIRFGAHGNTMSLSTACASGTSAIGEAYRAIKDGYLTAAICGGSEAAVNPLCVSGFINCMALSHAEDPNMASLPFDKRRAGFVIGEGAGIMILEEYEHAAARGAHIYAEVCGYGATCDAHHVTAPDPEATYTANAITKALDGIDCPAEKIYINAHGTGTALNDKTETKAFKKAFGDDAGKLHISSTKSMTGHMLGAAGAVEAIAAVKALISDTVPPTINLRERDEECDLDYTPETALRTELELALSTSLGFGGHNACLAFRKI